MKALLVVDVQNITLGKKHNKHFNYKNDIVDKINSLIKEYDSENVFYIKNITKNNFINKFFKIKCFDNSYESNLVDNLVVVSNNIFTKYKGNAFSNKNLEILLKEKEIKEIHIVGVDTAGCIALTAAGAIKRNYKVKILEKYTDTKSKKSLNNVYKNLEKMGIEIDKSK